jgi:hypothetical protein
MLRGKSRVLMAAVYYIITDKVVIHGRGQDTDPRAAYQAGLKFVLGEIVIQQAVLPPGYSLGEYICIACVRSHLQISELGKSPRYNICIGIQSGLPGSAFYRILGFFFVRICIPSKILPLCYIARTNFPASVDCSFNHGCRDSMVGAIACPHLFDGELSRNARTEASDDHLFLCRDWTPIPSYIRLGTQEDHRTL